MRLEILTHARNARGPGYSLRFEATVRTRTVHANLGPWVPGPQVPGPGSSGPWSPGPLNIVSPKVDMY